MFLKIDTAVRIYSWPKVLVENLYLYFYMHMYTSGKGKINFFFTLILARELFEFCINKSAVDLSTDKFKVHSVC